MPKGLPKWTGIILSVGTLFSITVGALSAYLTHDWTNSLITLLASETIVLLVSLVSLIGEFWIYMKDVLGTMAVLVRAREFVLHSKDELFYERYMRLVGEAERLSSGVYTIVGETELNDDDVRSINNLPCGEDLLSVCPFEYSDKDAGVLESTSYGSFMEAQFNAAERGVSVCRIYVFRDSSTFYQRAYQEHLQSCVDRGLYVWFLLLDSAIFSGARELPTDFIVFGDRKVSIGLLGEDSAVKGGEVLAGRDAVKSYIREFNRLKRLAKAYHSKHD